MSQSPTNKKFKKPSSKFDASAFARDLLKGESGVASALERLRIAIRSGSDVLSELLSDEHKHLFEYTFSILDDDGLVYVLRKDLLSRFHLNDGSLIPSGSPILERFSKFVYFLPYASDDVKPESLLENYRFVSDSQEALRALATIGFLEQMTPTTDQPEEGEIFGKKSRRPSYPKQMKHAKRSRADTIRIVERPFNKLNAPVPSTKEEAQALAYKLFQRQKELLAEFVDLLRMPALSSTMRELYIPTNVVQQPNESSKMSETEAHVPPVEAEMYDEVPAYPHIQPIKASLHFDNADGFGEWPIVISDSACKDLRACEAPIFQAILTKLKELSNGIFSEENQKRLKGPDKGIPVFEVRFSGRLTGDLRLVYQVDVLSESVDREFQAIRVFGIFTHAQMDGRMWASLSAQLTVRGPKYCRRINFRKQGAKGKRIFLPQSWPDISEEKEASADAKMKSLVSQEYQEQLHKWLVLEKYTAFSQALLECIQADKDTSTVFSVSPREREIIEHPSSCYVLGRSGTGKTTTMAFKIFGIERTAKTSMDPEMRPRQLFVTQSPVLADKVREYHAKLSDFLSAATGMPLPRPSEELQTKGELGDPEGDDDSGGDLPMRFSELEQRHFPLFLTFNKLYRLLEADLGLSLTRPSLKKKRRWEKKGNTISDLDLEVSTGVVDAVADNYAPNKEAERNSCVTFETFCSNYWPHFPQNLTKHLDPALVFSELIGVIKGSEQTLKSKNNYLNRDEYLDLSERTRPISVSLRERIYSLFEKYTSLKREYGDHDLADRCHAIFQRMKGGHKYSIDFLYVDEAQDILIIDAFVLRMLCRNPHGLFWAGDSAQTIAIGSSFRFDDLKSALYNFERNLYQSLNENSLVQPSFFQLTTNYRSHGGIVNCAGLIIEVIVHFWPNSIDTLRKEKGLVDGARPIFFTGSNDETARYEQFLLGDDGKAVEFGARQCILVRDDTAKSKLREQVGDIGIILTLYESKGLEFDDVLLYDFFATSQYDISHWRVVHNFLLERSNSNIAAPVFNEIRHAGICTELKFLYVAVTRARKNLWIIDRSKNGDPIKTLLSDLGRIDVLTPDKAPKLAEASSPQEWEKAGKELFRSERYAQAMHCFERAALHNECSIAEAFYLRQQARKIPRRNERFRIEEFLKAGHAFFCCAEHSKRLGIKFFHYAAECFQESRAYDRVALAYEMAKEYSYAARYYCKATQFDDAVRVVKAEKPIDPDTKDRIIAAARLHYTQMKEFEKAKELFDSQDDYLEFLEDFGFDIAKAEVLEKIGLLPQAADAYFRGGDEKRAIQLFVRDLENPVSVQHATKYVIDSLWRQTPFGIDTKCRDREIENYLDVLRDRYRIKPPADQGDVDLLDMFHAIIKEDKNALLEMYGIFLSKGRENPQVAVLVLDRLLTPNYAVNGVQEAIKYVQACLTYSAILNDVWNHPKLTQNPRTQRLLGFRKLNDDEDKFLLIEGCFLAVHSAGNPLTTRGPGGIGVTRSSHELTRDIKGAIKSRLSTVLEIQDAIFTATSNRLFGELCLTHAVNRKCKRDVCNRQHADLKSVNTEWFNMRVRAHLLQIRFLQSSGFALQDSYNRNALRNKWLTRLFNVLNPSLSAFGNRASIPSYQNDEFREGMRVLGLWTEDRAYQMGIHCRNFWNLAIVVTDLSFWHDSGKARKLIPQTRFYTAHFIVPSLVKSMDMSDPNFISSGCTLLCNALKYKLRISVDYLCQIVEVLSGSSILLYANASGKFHERMIPRSWLLRVASRLDFDQRYNIRRPIWELIYRCIDLASHLLLGSDEDVRHLGGASAFIVKSVAIHRILRAITLVGCNTTIHHRELILQLINKLGASLRNDTNHIDIVKPFLLSRTWHHLRRAAERSYFSSSLDEMLQLIQIGYSITIPCDAAIRRIRFESRQHLLSLIAPIRVERTSSLSPRAEPFIPPSKILSTISEGHGRNEPSDVTEESTTVLQENPDHAEEHRQEENEGNAEGDDHGEDAIERDEKDLMTEQSDDLLRDASVIRRDAAARVIQLFFRNRRAERAALILQRRCRCILRRKAEMDQPGIRGRRATYYWRCFAFDSNKNGRWPSNHHRVSFLGLLPDLLVCIEALQSQNQLDKDRAKRRLKSSSKTTVDDYDEVNMRITRANDNGKRLANLNKLLNISSDWHESRTKEDLVSVVMEIADFFKRLRVEGDALNTCLHVRDAVQQRKPPTPKKKERPKLNIAD